MRSSISGHLIIRLTYLCVPYAPSFGIRQHDEIDKAHDLLEHKALYHGDEHRRRQVEEVELRQLSDASGPHGDYL